VSLTLQSRRRPWRWRSCAWHARCRWRRCGWRSHCESPRRCDRRCAWRRFCEPATDGWLGDALDVVAKNLAMTLGATPASFAMSRHDVATVRRRQSDRIERGRMNDTLWNDVILIIHFSFICSNKHSWKFTIFYRSLPSLMSHCAQLLPYCSIIFGLLKLESLEWTDKCVVTECQKNTTASHDKTVTEGWKIDLLTCNTSLYASMTTATTYTVSQKNDPTLKWYSSKL